VVLLTGSSGSGKSSLVRAGLLPALAAGVLPASVRSQVSMQTPAADGYDELAESATVPQAEARRLVIVDQLEELFAPVLDSCG
jgi:excinuclease UvrABC ATPase subunit